MSVRFNVNDQVLIKVTKRGEEIFNKYYKELGLDPSPYVEMYLQRDGRFKMQMHEVMHVFGPELTNGCTIPFETEIEFV